FSYLEGSPHRSAAGAAYQNALFAGDAAGGLEGVAVGDCYPVGYDGAVVGSGDEVLADALDFVGAGAGLCVDRAFGVGTDYADIGVLLLQVAADAGDGAAGAHARYEGVHFAV